MPRLNAGPSGFANGPVTKTHNIMWTYTRVQSTIPTVIACARHAYECNADFPPTAEFAHLPVARSRPTPCSSPSADTLNCLYSLQGKEQGLGLQRDADIMSCNPTPCLRMGAEAPLHTGNGSSACCVFAACATSPWILTQICTQCTLMQAHRCTHHTLKAQPATQKPFWR